MERKSPDTLADGFQTPCLWKLEVTVRKIFKCT